MHDAGPHLSKRTGKGEAVHVPNTINILASKQL